MTGPEWMPIRTRSLFRAELTVQLLEAIGNFQGSINRAASTHRLPQADRCTEHRQQTIAGELVDDAAVVGDSLHQQAHAAIEPCEEIGG